MKPSSDDLLLHELREAAGDAAARRVAGELPEPSGQRFPGLVSSRLLLSVLLALALVLSVFTGLLVGGWWWLPVALAILLAAAAGVVAVAFGLLSEVESPDPAVAAQLEARGIADPERELNDLIERSQGREPGHRVRRLFGDDAGELEPAGRDGGRAGSDQQVAWTPSSGASRPVGPRSPRRRR